MSTETREYAKKLTAQMTLEEKMSQMLYESPAIDSVDRFWNTPLRTGDRRYYDNFLYLFAMLALSGNYRIYK